MFEEIVGAQKLPTGEVKTNKKLKKYYYGRKF